jgi:guanylate kinase
MDVQGAIGIHKDHPDWNFIFLNSALEELEKRMKSKYSA